MTLEGALGPNSRLDEASGLRVAAAEVVSVAEDGQLLFSSGEQVCLLPAWGRESMVWKSFDRPVTALACSPHGRVAVGLAGGAIHILDQSGEASPGWIAPAGLSSVADCLFLSEDDLAIVDHGYRADESVLSVAPWDPSERGKLLIMSRSGETRMIADRFHCPMGLCRDQDGEIIVAEFERGRIVSASRHVRQSGFPAYLGRIRKSPTGYIMACLARRDPLIEFLKTEQAFVNEMKARIQPHNWIAPRLSPDFSHDFPIELGATRLFGQIKPWAPSFSYGLVIALDNSLMPVGSAHSLANGRRHAITDVAVWNGDLIAVSKASSEILNLGPASEIA
jgi:hypothetical protein